MLELLQFRHSPYNEKVRWALDLKQVPHVRTPLLPGPHLLRVKRLTGGASFTPVLVRAPVDGGPLNESAAIVEWLEARYSQPRLVPADAGAASEARRIAAWFDADIGPRARRAVLDALLDSPSYFAAVFGAGHGRVARALFALTVPLAEPVVRKGNGISGPESVDDGHAAFDEGLAFVARRAAATGYLVGSSFGLADLSAASMLAMGVDVPHSPMSKPQPVAARYASLLKRYAASPGADWVRGIYARHRGAATDFNGPSAYRGTPPGAAPGAASAAGDA